MQHEGYEDEPHNELALQVFLPVAVKEEAVKEETTAAASQATAVTGATGASSAGWWSRMTRRNW